MRAAIFLGAGGAAMISIGSVISMTGNNMGQLLNGSRTIFALAENGDLPRWFGKVHPRLPHAVERDPVRRRRRVDPGAVADRSSRWPRSAPSRAW